MISPLNYTFIYIRNRYS
uniref:Uncharacterized protein n=1 Tax=Anguilla anguilla TaxID=7936 RepID=A0A0E9VHD3_ANGAN